jgi:hypothetical protein
MPTEETFRKIFADDTFMGNYVYKRYLTDMAKTCSSISSSSTPRGEVFNYYTPNSELITRAAFSP